MGTLKTGLVLAALGAGCAGQAETMSATPAAPTETAEEPEDLTVVQVEVAKAAAEPAVEEEPEPIEPGVVPLSDGRRSIKVNKDPVVEDEFTFTYNPHLSADGVIFGNLDEQQARELLPIGTWAWAHGHALNTIVDTGFTGSVFIVDVESLDDVSCVQDLRREAGDDKVTWIVFTRDVGGDHTFMQTLPLVDGEGAPLSPAPTMPVLTCPFERPKRSLH